MTTEPLSVRWDRTVIHPDPLVAGDPTIVCCLADDGQPVALLLDDELREALGGQLLEPNPDADISLDRVHDELWRHLDWSFWGTGMGDTFREPLADTMIAAISPEQREQANDLITWWRTRRDFVGRDKYEEQKAEIERLKAELAGARAAALGEAEQALASMLEGMPDGNLRYRGITFAVGVVQGIRLCEGPAAPQRTGAGQ